MLRLQRMAASECGLAAPPFEVGIWKAEFAKVAICALQSIMKGVKTPTTDYVSSSPPDVARGNRWQRQYVSRADCRCFDRNFTFI
jgi:hypothetical protein